jgi:hypothetical protein
MEKIRKCLDNKNPTHHILCNAMKAAPRGKSMTEYL